ncbi:MAG: YbaB/EbfC family nucleoid-associated protein [Spirochaetia bacterium]|nr:YbaB/EbfC family nucleoid-associated protein [Spirochaetia bacterium]
MNFGDFGNIKDLLSQVKDAQKHVTQIQKELREMRVEVQTGAGIVTAIVDGEATLIDIKLDTSLLENNELKNLPNLIVKAVQEAQKKAKKESVSKARSLGINLPGLGL